MHETTKMCIILYALIVALTATASHERERTSTNVTKCTTERTSKSDGDFIWQLKYSDVDYVISKNDACWQNNTLVVRKCDIANGSAIWLPKVQNCEKFKRKNSQCPEDLAEEFVNDKVLCLKISEKPKNFNENDCYGSNYILNANDQQMMIFLLKRNIESFWLPVKRIEEKGFQPYVTRLPGVMWNKLYEDIPFDKQISSPNKDCVRAFLINSGQMPQIHIEPISCNDSLHSICFFRDDMVAKNGCPQNFGALSYRPNECYGLTWEGQKYPDDMRMLSVLEYYEKYNVLKTIFSGHNIRMDGDVEIRGTTEIPNGKWIVNMKRQKLFIAPMGERVKNVCVEHVSNRKNVGLVLRKDKDEDMLVLTVYNKFYIWSFNNKKDFNIHCFAHTNYGELLIVELEQIWENELQTKTMFELNIKNDDTGLYWCEAHTIFNFTIAASEKIVIAKKKEGHNFALQFDVSTKGKDTMLATLPIRKIMKILSKEIEKEMKDQKANDNQLDDLVIHNIRIMDIVRVSDNPPKLRFLCHAISSLKSTVIDQSSETSYNLEDEEKARTEIEALMLIKDLLVQLLKKMQPHLSHTVRSTEYCFHENLWPRASIGETVAASQFCLLNNGLPPTRKCKGNFMEGAMWDSISSSFPQCIADDKHKVITKDLFNMVAMKVAKKDPEKAVKNIRKILESNLGALIPADLHYLAKIIRKSVKNILRDMTANTAPLYVNTTTQWELQQKRLSEILLEIDRIYNYLMAVDSKVMHSSLVLNSTNILLDTFEYIIDEMSVYILEPNVYPYSPINGEVSVTDQEIDVIEFKYSGVVVKAATNFVIFAIKPTVANVTGVALFRDEEHSDEEDGPDSETKLRGAFVNEYYRFIFANHSANDLLNEDNIVVGTFVPASLWQRLDEISSLHKNKTLATNRPEPSVVIKIYSNDKLFQEDEDYTKSAVMGKIISISIPGHDKDLPEMLPLILSNTNYNIDENHIQYCSYWNYKIWANDGLTLLGRSDQNNDTILCGCTHLTPFAYLVRGSYNLSIDSEVEVVVTILHENVLNIITLLGCSLSIFGVIGIVVTACTFSTWRQKANSKVLLQLSAAIALQMILFCFVNTTEYSHHLIANEIFPSCIAIGALLHYSVLVQFCWMVIIAYLQFKRYVQVFGNTRPKRFFVKSSLIGWGLPTIPVALVLTFDRTSYIPHANDSNNPICYPSGRSLYIGIVLPISLVILANLVIFVVVIINIVKSPSGSMRHTDKRFALSQVRLLLLLFFLLGLTWIFGLLTAMGAGLVFSYLFCLTATLQGFILFIYFILMDPITRRMWCGNLRRWFHLKDTVDKSSSTKIATQSF